MSDDPQDALSHLEPDHADEEPPPPTMIATIRQAMQSFGLHEWRMHVWMEQPEQGTRADYEVCLARVYTRQRYTEAAFLIDPQLLNRDEVRQTHVLRHEACHVVLAPVAAMLNYIFDFIPAEHIDHCQRLLDHGIDQVIERIVRNWPWDDEPASVEPIVPIEPPDSQPAIEPLHYVQPVKTAQDDQEVSPELFDIINRAFWSFGLSEWRWYAVMHTPDQDGIAVHDICLAHVEANPQYLEAAIQIHPELSEWPIEHQVHTLRHEVGHVLLAPVAGMVDLILTFVPSEQRDHCLSLFHHGLDQVIERIVRNWPWHVEEERYQRQKQAQAQEENRE